MERDPGTFRVVGSVHIAADPRLVERFLLDSGCFADWRRGVVGPVRASTPVLQPGTWVEFRGGAGPLRYDFVQIVAGHVPGRSLTLRTTQGPIDFLVELRWTAVAGGTRLEMAQKARLPQTRLWLVPVARRVVARNLRLDLASLEHLLESGGFRFTTPSPLTDHPPRCTMDPPPEFP